MVTPLTTSIPSSVPELPATPVKGEALPTQPSQTIQPGKQLPTSINQAQKQDSVTLSSTALDMSKALNQQHEQKTEMKQEAIRQQESMQSAEKESYKAMSKSYPPYMGNSEELKLLKESSPALYREILRMIVPPPLNISYSDKQMLENTHITSKSNNLSTTA